MAGQNFSVSRTASTFLSSVNEPAFFASATSNRTEVSPPSFHSCYLNWLRLASDLATAPVLVVLSSLFGLSWKSRASLASIFLTVVSSGEED